MPTPIAKTKSYLLSTDTNAGWIRTNTIADIDYMATTLSGSTDTVVINRINTEINATIPTSDPTVISTLLSVTGYWVNQPNWDTVIWQSNDSSLPIGITDTGDKKQYYLARIFGCTLHNQTYWSTTDSCQENNLYAFVDRTKNTSIYYKNSIWSVNGNYYTLPSGFPSPYTLTVISGKLTSGTTIWVYESDPEEFLGLINSSSSDKIISQTGSHIYANGDSIKFRILK